MPSSAHVATDDKTVLSRMNQFASAPPITSPDGDALVALASVPVWQDEEFDEHSLPDGIPCEETQMSCPFPSPPARGVLKLSEYSSQGLELEAEPSAPPFEVPSSSALPLDASCASAPPLHELIMESSAPPMETEDTSVSGCAIADGSGQNHEQFRRSCDVSCPTGYNS
jgi:hypothetical protein